MTSRPRTDEEIEEQELQLALALSRSEAETKKKEIFAHAEDKDVLLTQEQLRKCYGAHGGGTMGGGQSSTHSDPASQPTVINTIDTEDMDPELARYLNRNYWQKRSEDTKASPSAPQAANTSQSSVGYAVQARQSGEGADLDQVQFVPALQSSIEIFVNRMRSNSQRGRPIANDTSVQSLFTVINNMLPQLLRYQQEVEDKRAYYEGLQDKLAQLRDAREALDSLREEHREKLRKEMEELERQRQIQMMQKLEVMRQKKREYVEMQRQQALQRLQEQEREMAMRQEHQKHLTYMRQMQAYGYPQVLMSGCPQALTAGGAGMMLPRQDTLSSMGPVIPQNVPQQYTSGLQSTEEKSTQQLNAYGQVIYQQSHTGGREASFGLRGASAPVQSHQIQAMAMQPGLNHGTYTQGLTAPGSSGAPPFIPHTGNIPNEYQNIGSSLPPAHMQVDRGQGNIASGPGTNYYLPPASVGYTDTSLQHSSMGYTSVPPVMDYSSFNMQSLAHTLPQQQEQPQQGAVYSNMPGTQPPPQPPPQQSASDHQYMGGMPPCQYPVNRNNNHFPLPQSQHLQHQVPTIPQQLQGPVLDSQLISFD